MTWQQALQRKIERETAHPSYKPPRDTRGPLEKQRDKNKSAKKARRKNRDR